MIPLQSAESFAAMQLERQYRPLRAADDLLENRLWRARRDYVKALGNSPLRLKYPSLPLFLRAVESAIAFNSGDEFSSHF